MKKLIFTIIGLTFCLIGLAVFLDTKFNSTKIETIQEIKIPESDFAYTYKPENKDVTISIGYQKEAVKLILGAPDEITEPDNTVGREYWFYHDKGKVFGFTDDKVSSIRILD